MRLVKDLEQVFVVRCSTAEARLVSKLISPDPPFFGKSSEQAKATTAQAQESK